jgi:hypothetical protein
VQLSQYLTTTLATLIGAATTAALLYLYFDDAAGFALCKSQYN